MIQIILRSIMKLLNIVKGEAGDFRASGVLGLAALGVVGLAVSWSAITSPEGAGIEAPAGGVAAHGPGCQGCGHDHGQEVRKRNVTHLQASQVVGDVELADAEIGQVMEVSFGDELKVRGTVNMRKEVAGGRTAISLSIIDRDGYLYWLQDAKGGVMGNVVVSGETEKEVYKFKKDARGWSFEKLPFQEYVCSAGNDGKSVGMLIDNAPFVPAGRAAIVPLLSSRPGAEAVMYLDFDGEVVSGTRWNANIGGADIDAEPSGHSEAEIREIWLETAEDMRPFELNVTTDRAAFDAAPVNRRMHVIITPTNDAAPGAGGVAYLESFYDGSIDPCWCFNLGAGSAAMTCSHEVGHTFGLLHDGNTAQAGQTEYHEGNGTWGPIMGAPFGHDVVNWCEGNYTNSTNTEDDLLLITDLTTNGFGYRPDDHGNSNADGTVLNDDSGNGSVSVTGVIETTDDVDVFSFVTDGGSSTLSALLVSSYPNMNIKASLFDDAGNLVVESEAPGYNATITQTLDPGTYHLHIEGVADGSPDVSGFNDYGSLGEFALTGNVAGLGGLILDIVQPQPEEVSVLEGNGLVLLATVVGVPDSQMWLQTAGPSGGVATFAPVDALASRATFTAPGIYTLAFRAVRNDVESEVTVKVSVEAEGDIQVYPNRGPAITVTSPEEFYSKEGYLSGRAIDDGIPVDEPPATEWIVVSGNAEIPNPTAAIPTITFADSAPNEVALESSDGQIRTFKQITVTSVYESRGLTGAGSDGRWFIPRDDSMGLTWTLPNYDDSLWMEAKMGVGYNSNLDYAAWVGEGGDLKSAMKRKSSSAFIRIPFEVPTLDYVRELVLKMYYNDGFVAYINGVEVARRNVPGTALTVSSKADTSRSLEDVSVADEITLDDDAVRSALVAGTNVLSIHGLNNAKGDKAFLMLPEIEAGVILSPYLEFLETYDLGLLPNEDDDADGLLNFVEHALRTDPFAADAYNPFSVDSNGLMNITLPQDAPQDIDYIIQHSTDMQEWAEVASKHGSAEWVGNGITVRIDSFSGDRVTYSLHSLEASPSSYFRLVYKLRGPQGH